MSKFRDKRILLSLATLVIIATGGLLAVLFAKGYTFSPTAGKVVGTGIITVNSVPEGASVYVDGHLTTATNATLSQLSPRPYDIKIVKEGFISWEKKVDVKEGLVTEIKATLFPALPTIYPLTYNGAVSPILSPDSTQLAFTVPMTTDARIRQRGGVWVWSMNSSPISFNRSAEPHQVLVSAPGLDFSKAKLTWSPDSKQILVAIQENDTPGEANLRNYLIPSDRQNTVADVRDITPTVTATTQGWLDDQKTKDTARVATIISPEMKQVASSSATLKWSPDETKFIVVNNSVVNGRQTASPMRPPSGQKETPIPTTAKAYDLMTSKSYDLPAALAYLWLPDSRHVILVNSDKISISEDDGTNEAVIFAGSFQTESVFPWPDSSRIVILTSFNTPTAQIPNLFGINLK